MVFDILRIFTDYPLTMSAEIMRLLPDGIILVTGFFALLTTSFPYAILFGSLLESLLFLNGTKALFGYLHLSDTFLPKEGYSRKCVTGFRSPTLETVSLFTGTTSATFPSAPVFLLSTLSAYIFNSLNAQIKELEALGESYSARYYMSVIFLLLFLFMYCLFRMFANCDTFGSILMSLLFGLFIGSVLIAQNNALFGPDSINLLGIPLLRNRAADGSPLYICKTQTTSQANP
jgi:hypothetical protein